MDRDDNEGLKQKGTYIEKQQIDKLEDRYKDGL
jgi:hypothetical protein